MNEIQAEAKGTVLGGSRGNGQPFEYGQRLFQDQAGLTEAAALANPPLAS